MWTSASSFNFKYPLFSWSSSSSFVRLLPRLSVTFIFPSLFPSITCFRRQFLRKIPPIQLALLQFVYRILLASLTICSTSSLFTRSVQSISSILAPIPQPPIQWVPGSFPGVKRPECAVDRPPTPSSAEVKEGAEVYLYSPSVPTWRFIG